MITKKSRFRLPGLFAASGMWALTLPAHAACPFNPDAAGAAAGTATTDGLLFIRYALGVTASSGLGTNATQGGALPAAIASYIADPTNNAAIDIDGDGKFSPSDAMVIARYLFGFRGNALAASVPSVEFAKRYGGPSLQTYIDNGCTGINDLPDPRLTVWNAMNAQLALGTAAGSAAAKAFLTPNGVNNHGPAFDQLIARMPTIVPTYSPLIAREVGNDYAEYWMSRPVPVSATGERNVYVIIFIHQPDGSWKIDSM